MTLRDPAFVEAYWKRQMGLQLDPGKLPAGIYCTMRTDPAGVELFRRNGVLVICSPEDCADQVAAGIRGLGIEAIFSTSFIAGLLGPRATVVLGPAHAAYADDASFRGTAADHCRLLRTDEAHKLEEFGRALSPLEQE